MKVGLNARFLRKGSPTGVHKYTRELLTQLGDFESIDVVALGTKTLPADLNEDEYETVGGRGPHSGVTAHVWDQIVLPALATRHDIDVVHAPAGLPPLACPIPTVMTVHDLAPVRHPEWFTSKYALYYRTMIPRAVRHANEIIAVSQFTRDEIQAEYPSVADKTTVVHNGVTPPSGGEPPTPTPGDFFLFVGTMNRRKNLARTVSAYRAYRQRSQDPHELIVVGPDRDIFANENVPNTPGAKRLGYVPEATLGWLYRNATALVFPSLYEGFGFPIVEAMSVGTPVVTSNRGVMKEVSGTAAVLVDPEDVSGIAEGMERAIDDHTELAEKGKRQAATFDWSKAVARTIDVYRKLVETL